MNGSLFVFPTDPNKSCSLDILESALHELAMIGAPIARQARLRVFHADSGFAQQVVFAGCSPHLRFEPQHEGDLQFCHVALHGPFEEARLIIAQHPGKPRCPHCRAVLADWPARIAGAAPSPCSGCGRPLQASALDWRQGAAVGRVLVELRNVFPGEATPSDRMLATLQRHSGMPWRHAWATMLTANR